MKPIWTGTCNKGIGLDTVICDWRGIQRYQVALDLFNNVVIFGEQPNGYDGFVSKPILQNEINEILIITTYHGLNDHWGFYQYRWWQTSVRDNLEKSFERYGTYISEECSTKGHKKICEVLTAFQKRKNRNLK